VRRIHKPVPCKIETVGLENDLLGGVTSGVKATCSLCRHQTVSLGTSMNSVRECLSLMREECPVGASNEYGIDTMGSPHFEHCRDRKDLVEPFPKG
jgi:hypothetical protein